MKVYAERECRAGLHTFVRKLEWSDVDDFMLAAAEALNDARKLVELGMLDNPPGPARKNVDQPQAW